MQPVQLYNSVFATLTCFYAERHLRLLLHAEGRALRQLRQLRSIPSLRRQRARRRAGNVCQDSALDNAKRPAGRWRHMVYM